MSEFDSQSKKAEDAYFHRQEQERRRLDAERSRAEAERRELASATGLDDAALLDRLQQLGYTGETVKVLDLVPLVQVAWAEGNVTPRERDLVREIARSRGVLPGSPAAAALDRWLEEQPPEPFFTGTLEILRGLLASLPAEERSASQRDLVGFCTRVASASGGVLGLGRKVSADERALIERIAAELERDHRAAARGVLDEG